MIKEIILGDFPVLPLLDAQGGAEFRKLYGAVADSDCPSARDCLDLAQFIIRHTSDAARQTPGHPAVPVLMEQGFALVASAAAYYKDPELIDLKAGCELNGFGTPVDINGGLKTFDDARKRRIELEDPNAKEIFDANWAYGLRVRERLTGQKTQTPDYLKRDIKVHVLQ